MFYPVFMDLHHRPVLVIGGGSVAERKVESLVEAGAAVTVVTRKATERLRRLGSTGAIVLHIRAFAPSDLDGALLAISATDDPSTQKEIKAAAASRRVLVNTVDVPSLCDFIVPAIVRRGDVVLAISTSGKSPALAAALRARFSKLLTDDVARAARLLGSVRGEVHERYPDIDQRKRIFETIVDSGILDWIGRCDDDAALKRVRQIIDENV